MEDLEKKREQLSISLAIEMRESSNNLGRWCATTILVLHGSALLGLMDNQLFDEYQVKSVVKWFGIGMFISIISSMAASAGYGGMAAAITKNIWNGEGFEGEDIFVASVHGAPLSWIMFALSLLGNFISGLIFLYGCYELFKFL